MGMVLVSSDLFLCDEEETGYGTGVIIIISVIRMKLGMVLVSSELSL